MVRAGEVRLAFAALSFGLVATGCAFVGINRGTVCLGSKPSTQAGSPDSSTVCQASGPPSKSPEATEIQQMAASAAALNPTPTQKLPIPSQPDSQNDGGQPTKTNKPAEGAQLGGLGTTASPPQAGSLPWSALFGKGPERLPFPRKVEEIEPLTMHLDDVDVRKVLEILSREGALNILVSPGVSGRVTANLKGLSPEQTLNAILKLCNLVAQREKGVIYVFTPEELNKGGDKDQRLAFRVHRLNYIKSTDLEKMIKPFLSPAGKITSSPASQVGIHSNGSAGSGAGPSGGGGAAPSGGGASSSAGGGGGSTGGDSLAAGEVIVIQDRESVLSTLDQIIVQLDAQPSQVLIEAVIISMTLDNSHEFGVNFAVVDSAGKILTVVGNGATINAAVGFEPLRVLSAGSVRGDSGRGFAADEHGLKFGFVDKDVTGFLRALEHIGKVEVLASPRLLVLNKQQAELQLGDRLGYKTFSQSLVSTVEQVQFLDVGTLLRVRPFISTDGMVRMEIHPERSSGRVVDNVPQTSTSEVTTNVMVPDGATIVIGGLMENMDDRRQEGLPFLSRLPWLGALFRDRKHFTTKKELIVLLTPRIWNPHGPHGPTWPPAPLPSIQTVTPNDGEASLRGW